MATAGMLLEIPGWLQDRIPVGLYGEARQSLTGSQGFQGSPAGCCEAVSVTRTIRHSASEPGRGLVLSPMNPGKPDSDPRRAFRSGWDASLGISLVQTLGYPNLIASCPEWSLPSGNQGRG